MSLATLFFLAAVLAAALALGSVQAARAQDAAAEPTAAAVEEGVGATDTGAAGAAAGASVTANDVNDVARQLWCPLCSGVRLDACELKACAQMKDVIGQKLAEGEDVGAIKNYFVAQYGPQVLGEPPMEGFNWLAWILPVLAMVAGGLLVWSRVHKSTRRAQAASAAGAGSAPGDGLAGGVAGGPGSAAGDDPYGRKLEEELKHYD